MKRWMKIVIGVLVVLVVLLVALALLAGNAIKGAINTAGPKALGVPISVKSVNVGLLTGRFGLNELVIGNPEGFKTPEAIRLGKVAVKVNMASLFSKVLVIDRIYVGGPEITYEVGLGGSNIGAIQKKLAPSKPAEKQPEPAEQPAKPGKKVQINDFLIEGGRIHFSTVGMAGHEATIPLPAVHLTDIGKESDGASPQEVIAKVFGAIGSTVSSAATGIGTGAVDAGKAVGKGATKALESVEGLFKKK
jgi:uncharacterized protein involved in outer membrane biogenesis